MQTWNWQGTIRNTVYGKLYSIRIIIRTEKTWGLYATLLIQFLLFRSGWIKLFPWFSRPYFQIRAIRKAWFPNLPLILIPTTISNPLFSPNNSQSWSQKGNGFNSPLISSESDQDVLWIAVLKGPSGIFSLKKQQQLIHFFIYLHLVRFYLFICD